MNRSIGDVVLIGGVCLFASWTVFCHVMVSTESGFTDLMTWCFVPVVIGLILASFCIGETVSTDETCVGPSPASRNSTGIRERHAWLLIGIAALAFVLHVADAPYWSIWVVLLGTTILVCRMVATSSGRHNALPAPSWNWQRAGVAALVVLGAVLVAITHRPDIDDAQYLNFVVTALDFPTEPLFSHSGLWRGQSVPLEVPIYRFHTYELLSAGLSYTFNVDHKIFYYMILAPILGGVAVLVHWRLAQHLIPGHAFAFLLVWFVLIIALGESTRAFGNFAFVRMYQGKGPLVTVALPLCLLLGLRFAELPNWRRALALGMAVIASLGMSSSALATAPAVVGAAVGGGLLNASRASVHRILAGGLAALSFLIVIGVFLLITMKTGNGIVSGSNLPTTAKGLSTVLGGGILGGLVLSLFPIAPLFVSDDRRRRIYAASTLLFVIAVLNPWTAPFIAMMIDMALQWRIFWSVPLVISASVSLIGLAALIAVKLPRFESRAVLPLLLLGILLVSTRLSISTENKVVYSFPRYKVEPFGYALADEIVNRAPLRSTIYAPVSIAAWITTFRQHPYPLVVRPGYLYFGRIRKHVGVPELDRRKRVIRFLEGHNKHASSAEFFEEQLASDRPAMVAYANGTKTASDIASALGDAGYVGERRGQYWLWKRPLLAMYAPINFCNVQGKSSREEMIDCIDTFNPATQPLL